MNSSDILINGAKRFNVSLNKDQVRLFLEYLEILRLWNKKINLTSIKDENEIIIKHFIDSLSVVPFIENESRVLDIGSGAGFPGIPLKIVKPSIQLTLLDSTQKKVFFLLELINKLKLIGVNAVWGRAESRDNGVKRGYYSYVVSRAVGRIEDLIELSIPYLVDKGEIILMRGGRGLEEWERSKQIIKDDLRLLRYNQYELPKSTHKRVVLVIGLEV